MAPMKAMKSMKTGAKAMSKGALSAALAAEHEMKPKQVSEIIDSLVKVGTAEVKKSGIFTIPGLCRIKTRVKPATKAGKKMIFGKEVKVKAKAARTVVKAFAVAALKSQF
uniref:Major basic nuclear protein n=1 Tax=Karlodinium veneficum TaxID=407301 RepID=A7YXU0_KARVE|nr:major basic nuclear protein [Karlodinium veneficum]